MRPALDLLSQFRVRDVMRTEVVTVRTDDSLAHAAGVLSRRGVQGAPVVDAAGQCVGVISGSDLARQLAAAGPAAGVDGRSGTVAAHMTAGADTIDADAPLLAAARQLCEHGIHRLIVAEHGRPAGILSALDVVACLVVATESAGSLDKDKEGGRR